MMKLFSPLFLAAFAILTTGSQAPAEELPLDKIVARIVSDWEARQKQIHTIRYKLSGTWFHPKGKFDGSYLYNSTEAEKKLLASKGGHIPPKDTYLAHNVEILLDLESNHARKELRWHVLHNSLGDFVPHRTLYLFNGKTTKKYEPRDDNTSKVYTPGAAQPEIWFQNGGGASPIFFQTEDTPILWACGNADSIGIAPGSLRTKYAKETILYHGKGIIEGRECVILRTKISDPSLQMWREYWVDTARQSTILRCVGHFEGHIDFHFEVKNQSQQGFWLPSDWRYTYYEGGEFYHEIKLKADEIEINPAVQESDFDIAAKPGMVVNDLDKNQRGVVAPDGHTLLPLSALNKERRWPAWKTVLFAALAALAICMTAVWLARRWKRRGIAPQVSS